MLQRISPATHSWCAASAIRGVCYDTGSRRFWPCWRALYHEWLTKETVGGTALGTESVLHVGSRRQGRPDDYTEPCPASGCDAQIVGMLPVGADPATLKLTWPQ
jgi:hypothetical protein